MQQPITESIISGNTLTYTPTHMQLQALIARIMSVSQHQFDSLVTMANCHRLLLLHLHSHMFNIHTYLYMCWVYMHVSVQVYLYVRAAHYLLSIYLYFYSSLSFVVVLLKHSMYCVVITFYWGVGPVYRRCHCVLETLPLCDFYFLRIIFVLVFNIF